MRVYVSFIGMDKKRRNILSSVDVTDLTACSGGVSKFYFPIRLMFSKPIPKAIAA